ncbi:MAG: hypothetical protein BMS9Abin20_0789 [Acidimicrobiia bacterium]|nr:MAG: hypothetical protein BMS9Abin20_0789 [Acidimicrobiia bacterium]
MMYGYGWWAPLGGLFMFAILGLFVWLIVTAVRPARAGNNESRAIEILADRYARGEIDGEEFRSRRSIIEESL